MTDQELKDLVASLAIAQKETSRQMAQNALQMDRNALQMEESNKKVEALQKETAKQIKQTQKQLGELGNKWGTFTEGMATASIKKILREKFNIPVISRNVEKSINGETIEIDIFGYENSTVNTAVIVEIKSHLRDDIAEQVERIMADFPKFFPDHAGKKLYGVVACVYAPESIKNLLRKKGIYLAVLHDDIFELYDFENFTPKDFSHS